MPDDPNIRFIGYEFDSDSGRLRVKGTSPFLDGYMVCDYVNSTRPDTVRPTSVIRRAIELEVARV
jgi:hypothetical protein